MDRILDLVRPLVQHVGLFQAQVQSIRPPVSSTRLASINLVSTTLKLPPWITAEHHLVTLLTISMTSSMLWKILIAVASNQAAVHPRIRLNLHGLLLATGGIILTITRHIDTRLSRVTVELIEQSVDIANAVLALDIVASLPALVLWQNFRLSIVSSLTLDQPPMLTLSRSSLHLQRCLDWGPLTLRPFMPRTSADTRTRCLRPLISSSQRCIGKPRSHM